MSGSGNNSFVNNPIFNNMANSGNMSGVGSGAGMGCGNLTFETQLISPQPKVVSKLQLREILALQLNGQNNALSIHVLKDNNLVGAIVNPQLLSCMQQGHQYSAEVEKINNGQVTVLIKPI